MGNADHKISMYTVMYEWCIEYEKFELSRRIHFTNKSWKLSYLIYNDSYVSVPTEYALTLTKIHLLFRLRGTLMFRWGSGRHSENTCERHDTAVCLVRSPGDLASEKVSPSRRRTGIVAKMNMVKWVAGFKNCFKSERQSRLRK